MDMKKIIDMMVADDANVRAELARQLSNEVGKTVYGPDFEIAPEPTQSTEVQKDEQK
jgi:hypothetical protein